MGIYNCEHTLVEALDSLYAQTYQGFKIILCDDGSTDNTYEVAKSYQSKHDNIILLKNEHNIKLAATLNRCLAYADTEYVARMDGDDISLPTRFEKEIEFLDENPDYAVVSCAMVYFDENGDWGVGSPIAKPTKMDFKNGTPFAHAPSMTRTKVIKEVEGYTVNKYLERQEDYYLWYKIYKNNYEGYNLTDPLYKMRDDQNAMLRRTFKSRYYGFIVKKQVMSDLGIPNPLIFALPNLLKAFVPNFLMKILRKKKMKY